MPDNVIKYIRTPDGTTYDVRDDSKIETSLMGTANGVATLGSDGKLSSSQLPSSTIPLATSSVRGGVKIGYTKSGYNYPVQLSDEKMYVNVPPKEYIAGTGLALVNDYEFTTFVDNASGSVDTMVTSGEYAVRSCAILDDPVIPDGNYHVYESSTSQNYGVQIAFSVGSNNAYYRRRENGVWDAWQSLINTDHYAWSDITGKPETFYTLPLAANGTRGGVQVGYEQNGKNYPVQLSSEKMYVNVPWTDSSGNDKVLKTGDTMTGNLNLQKAGEIFIKVINTDTGVGVYLDSSVTTHGVWSNGYYNGSSFVNSGAWMVERGTDGVVRLRGTADSANAVPWSGITGKPTTFYTLPLAANGTRGGAQVGFTTDATNKNYAVQLSGEKMYVNVPWTDTNTWRPVQNNLTSTSTTDCLSAAQGKALQDGKRDNTAPASGNWFRGTPTITSAGVMEVGKYIDFHDSNASTADYSARITASNSGLTLSGTTSGTFSGNLSGNATSATKATQDGNGNNIVSRYLPYIANAGLGEVAGGGQNNYFLLATLTVTSEYQNSPVVFEVSRRGYGFQRLQVMFVSTSSLDPELGSFVTDGNTTLFWIKRSATSTWQIYGQYNEVWGACALHRITGRATNNGVTVTVNLTNAGTTAPGGTAVTRFWSASYADSAGAASSATTASKLSTDAGNANTPIYFSGGVPATGNNKLGAVNANGYWGMRGADNGDSWIRTTTSGIIPVQSGGAGSGHCGLGTSSWYFSSAYIDNVYGKLHGDCTGSSGSCTGNAATATKATQDGNGANIASTYMSIGSVSKSKSIAKNSSVSLGMGNNTVALAVSYNGNAAAFMGAWLIIGASTTPSITTLKSSSKVTLTANSNGTITVKNADTSYAASFYIFSLNRSAGSISL